MPLADEIRTYLSSRTARSPSYAANLLERAADELDRLWRGDFTEEEFQNLCHNLDESDGERFKAGCREYWRKLGFERTEGD